VNVVKRKRSLVLEWEISLEKNGDADIVIIIVKVIQLIVVKKSSLVRRRRNNED